MKYRPVALGGTIYLDGSPLLFGLTDHYTTASWDPVTGRKIAEYPIVFWSAVAASTNGRWIAFGERATQVFDVRSGKPVAFLTKVGEWSRSLSFSSDGRRLAVAENGRAASVYDTTTWEPIGEIGTPADGIVAVRYSPDGSTLATIGDDGRITLRDPITNAPRRTLVGSSYGTLGDAPLWFSADGRYALSGSDGKARLWDLRAAVQIGDPFPNDDDFQLDGNDGLKLLTAVGDHMLLWNLDPATWLAIACRAAGRNLSAEEWRTFGPAGEPYHQTCDQ